jgi:hypothetical protein
MKYVFFFCLAMSFNSFAEVAPERVGEMLEQMVRENVISRDEANKAIGRLKNISPDDWKAIKKKAESAAKRYPASNAIASNNKIEDVKSLDLDGEQFKTIQNDLRKIVPQYQD